MRCEILRDHLMSGDELQGLHGHVACDLPTGWDLSNKTGEDLNNQIGPRAQNEK